MDNIGPQRYAPNSLPALKAQIKQVMAEFVSIKEKEGREHLDIKEELDELELQVKKIKEQEEREAFIKSTDLYKYFIGMGLTVEITEHGVSCYDPALLVGLDF
jgi:hypothetical protein